MYLYFSNYGMVPRKGHHLIVQLVTEQSLPFIPSFFLITLYLRLKSWQELPTPAASEKSLPRSMTTEFMMASVPIS